MKFGKPKPSTAQVKSEIREAIAQNDSDDQIITGHQAPEVIEPVPDSEDHLTGDSKLSRLVDDDFPFDESQLAAVSGMVKSQYACLTGAAGTGKTTTTKKLVDELIRTTAIGRVDMTQYWAKSTDDRQEAYVDGDDGYSYDESNAVIPTIAMCSFTGRASQQIKQNFPRDWHGNIMTIHRMLGFVPEMYEDWDPDHRDSDTGELGAYRTKMRFVPTYTEACRLPWDVILIDEAGMLGLDLWHQLFAAIKPGCRIYMVGDINQLPPVHGKSIFGFAMAKWPAFELTKVHRQQGVNNPIVDNAWRVIHGQMPQPEGRFQMIKLKGDAQFASRQVRAMAPKLLAMNIYDPIRDSIITPINGEEGSRGAVLGQLPLNREFAMIFNPKTEHPRFIIDGGRERKQFAVGDKVMATRNDWEAGITNGMTGIITSIARHEGYAGESRRFGLIDEVNAYIAEESAGEGDYDALSMDDLESSMAAIDEGAKQAKEKKDRGPASHIVTVRFGSEEHGFEIPFSTLAEVGTLMTAYVVTCHKMQGGEAPVIIIICHDSHRHMLYREWLYTAITRASDKCILLYTEDALRSALNKQNIKGSTLKEKVTAFNALMDNNGKFDWDKEVKLPISESTSLTIMDREDKPVMTDARLTTEAERKGGIASLLGKKREAAIQVDVNITVKETRYVYAEPEAAPVQPIDGGTLESERAPRVVEPDRPAIAAGDSIDHPVGGYLPAPARLIPQLGALHTLYKLEDARAQLLLAYQPTPIVPPKEELPKRGGLWALLNKQKELAA